MQLLAACGDERVAACTAATRILRHAATLPPTALQALSLPTAVAGPHQQVLTTFSSNTSAPGTSAMLLLPVQHTDSSNLSPLQVLDVLHQSLPLPLQQLTQLAPDGLHARGAQLRPQGQHLRARLARLIAARGPACSRTCPCLRAQSADRCIQGGVVKDSLCLARQMQYHRHTGDAREAFNEETLWQRRLRAKHPILYFGCSKGCAGPYLTGLWTGETCAGRRTLLLDAKAAKLDCPAGRERSISFCVCLTHAGARPACMDAEESRNCASSICRRVSTGDATRDHHEGPDVPLMQAWCSSHLSACSEVLLNGGILCCAATQGVLRCSLLLAAAQLQLHQQHASFLLHLQGKSTCLFATGMMLQDQALQEASAEDCSLYSPWTKALLSHFWKPMAGRDEADCLVGPSDHDDMWGTGCCSPACSEGPAAWPCGCGRLSQWLPPSSPACRSARRLPQTALDWI